MASHHRAAVYSVYVHRKFRTNELKPLGNFDGKGSDLGDVLTEYLDDFTGGSKDGSKHVHCDAVMQSGDYIFVSARHGQTGVAADLVNTEGETVFHQTPDHEHVLPASSLFCLPRSQTRGWWVTHINNGRSAKNLLQSRLTSRFKEHYNDGLVATKALMLKFDPVVNKGALQAAVEQDRVEKVRLRTLNKPSDIAAIDRWIPSNTSPNVSLEIAAAGKGSHVLPAPIRRFLKGDEGALDEIVEFGDLTFEEASATVRLPNGKTKTINIQAREGGHAYTLDLDGLVTVDGEPDANSLEYELKRVLLVVQNF